MAVSKRPIVVGVDGSGPSTAAVSWAAAEADRLRAELHLVIAGDPARAGYAEETVRAVAAKCRHDSPDLTVTEEVVVDHPVHALVHRSTEAQMIAVGSRGRSGFVNALLGSVSVPVAAQSSCPVVVVHSGKRSGKPRSARKKPAESTGSPSRHDEPRSAERSIATAPQSPKIRSRANTEPSP